MKSVSTYYDVFSNTFLGNFTLPVLLSILLIILIVSTTLLFRTEKAIIQNNIKQTINDNTMQPTKRQTIISICKRTCLYVCVLTAAILLLSTIRIWKLAKQHGCININTAISHMLYSIDNTPEEDTLPTDSKDIVVIFYRFGCKDCEALYPQLREATANVNHVYWISSRSKQGEKLRKLYPIQKVPIGIYIDKQGVMHTYTLYSKSYQDKQPVITLQTKNLQDLLHNIMESY